MSLDVFETLREFTTTSGKMGMFYSLPALEKAGVGPISRLPVSIRIVLASVLRNQDGKKITTEFGWCWSKAGPIDTFQFALGCVPTVSQVTWRLAT